MLQINILDIHRIIEGLDIGKNLNCVVTGDMVLNAKPASDGLLKAAELVQTSVNNTMYVGDDERDIVAGKKAGMITVAANFGFIDDEININSWEADIIIDNPLNLKKYLVN